MVPTGRSILQSFRFFPPVYLAFSLFLQQEILQGIYRKDRQPHLDLSSIPLHWQVKTDNNLSFRDTPEIPRCVMRRRTPPTYLPRKLLIGRSELHRVHGGLSLLKADADKVTALYNLRGHTHTRRNWSLKLLHLQYLSTILVHLWFKKKVRILQY